MADSDHEDLFASPSKTPTTPPPQERPRTPANQSAPFDAEEAREAALRKELEGVRSINEALEGVIGTLERARGNMGVRVLGFGAQLWTPTAQLTRNPSCRPYPGQ